MPPTENDHLLSSKQDKAEAAPASVATPGEAKRPETRLVDDTSMFLDMQVALLAFLETYDGIYSPRGYQDAAIARCAQAARLALTELASHTNEG